MLYGVVLLVVSYFNSFYYIHYTALVAFLINKLMKLSVMINLCTVFVSLNAA